MRRLQMYSPLLFLLVAPPILIEVLSGNTPPTVIFQPLIFIIYLIVYGFPIILIADAIPRWRLSLSGILILGYAYGLYNEAIVAKTVFAGNVLSPAYNGYGELLGLNFSWIFSILTFHAFLSVLFPILFARELFPDRLLQPFLSNTTRIILLAITGTLGYLLYVTPNTLHNTPLTYFWIFVGVIGLSILSAKHTARGTQLTMERSSESVTIYPALWGSIAPLFFLVTLHFIVNSHLPTIAYFLFTIFFFISYSRLITKRYKRNTKHVLVFCLGNYIGLSGIGIILTGLQKIDVLIWNTLFIIMLIIIIQKYKQKYKDNN